MVNRNHTPTPKAMAVPWSRAYEDASSAMLVYQVTTKAVDPRKTTLSPKDAHAPVRIRMMNTATVASSKTGRVVTMRWLAAMTVACPRRPMPRPRWTSSTPEARSLLTPSHA